MKPIALWSRECLTGPTITSGMLATGERPWPASRELKPGLVLLDIRMPHLDGHEALAAIRKIPGLELLPVIAVSASDPENDEQELRSRFNAYIRKPFTRQTFTKNWRCSCRAARMLFPRRLAAWTTRRMRNQPR